MCQYKLNVHEKRQDEKKKPDRLVCGNCLYKLKVIAACRRVQIKPNGGHYYITGKKIE